MIRVLELFSGIGACSKALENLGIEYEIVDSVEIDKFAVKSFNAIHGTNFEPQDITKWDKDIECDLIMHGSPCQDFSTAGKNAGGDKGSGTRSSLLYESLRIIKKTKPKYVVWENVKNLLSKKHFHNFQAYLDEMSNLGYVSNYKVLNAKDYGVPQNRERVFTVSIRKDLANNEFKFPEPIILDKRLKDILEDEVEDKYFLSNKRLDSIHEWEKRQKENGRGFRFEVRDGNDIGRTVTTSGDRPCSTNYICLPGAYGRSFGSRGKIQNMDGTSCTLLADMGTGGGNIPLVTPKYSIRKLTPKECWRLMGFDDVSFEKAAKVNSSTQLYKQAGNSIVVNVLEAIFRSLLNA